MIRGIFSLALGLAAMASGMGSMGCTPMFSHVGYCNGSAKAYGEYLLTSGLWTRNRRRNKHLARLSR